MFKFAIKNKTKNIYVSLKTYRNLLYKVIEYSKTLYFKQVVKNNKNCKQLWKIINNTVTTKSAFHSKTNGVLDVHDKFVHGPKEVRN